MVALVGFRRRPAVTCTGYLAGVHPKVAQERLGHSTISVTLDVYSHITATMQEDAAAKIDAAFRDAKMGSEGASSDVRWQLW